MSQKAVIMWSMILGSTIGGFVPNLWNSGMLSFSGILLTAIGRILGVWVGYRINNS